MFYDVSHFVVFMECLGILHCVLLHPLSGGRTGATRWSFENLQLPDMMDLNEYPPMYQQIGLPRRLGSTGSLEQSAQDTVYR